MIHLCFAAKDSKMIALSSYSILEINSYDYAMTNSDYGAAAEMFSAFIWVTLNEETAHAISVPFSGLQDQIWSMIRLGVLV